MRSTRSSLLAVTALMTMASSSLAIAEPPSLRSVGSGNNRRPTPPRQDTELQREIAAHNAAVDARKAAKRAAKSPRITPE